MRQASPLLERNNYGRTVCQQSTTISGIIGIAPARTIRPFSHHRERGRAEPPGSPRSPAVALRGWEGASEPNDRLEEPPGGPSGCPILSPVFGQRVGPIPRSPQFSALLVNIWLRANFQGAHSIVPTLPSFYLHSSGFDFRYRSNPKTGRATHVRLGIPPTHLRPSGRGSFLNRKRRLRMASCRGSGMRTS